eukprot:CAMPEP_0170972984 /NCGR_PEP_ID=MMETSP0735-20130129/46379_1 /TAXON_ID=186038 /ORGANISM="Fragilariopsis kerguelensis, Strain L26-C5" /LENGTH=650 /DNA_ID=CAMNT_0011393709 /DNA_START=141 /DNA_END=2091 /DNA_ORIENTATION=-
MANTRSPEQVQSDILVNLRGRPNWQYPCLDKGINCMNLYIRMKSFYGESSDFAFRELEQALQVLVNKRIIISSLDAFYQLAEGELVRTQEQNNDVVMGKVDEDDVERVGDDDDVVMGDVDDDDDDDGDDDDEPNNTDTPINTDILLPLSHYVRNGGQKNLKNFNHAVEISIANVLELYLQQEMKEHKTLTRIAAKDKIMDMKSTGRNSPFGFINAKQTSILNDNNSSFWDLVMSCENVQAVWESTKQLNVSWWGKRLAFSFPWKSCHRGKPNLNAIGGRLVQAEVTMDEADRNKLGLHMVFGDDTSKYVTALNAMHNGNTDSVPDIYGGFDETETHILAHQKVNSLLKTLAEHKNTTVANILNGKNLHQFLLAYRSKFDALESIVQEDGLKIASLLGLDRDEDKRYINPFLGIKFLTAVSIFCTFDVIVAGLNDQTLCVLRDVDNQYDFYLKVDEEMTIQYCIGAGCVQQGFHPNEYERCLITDGNYMVEQYPASTNCKDFLLLHLDAKTNYEGKYGDKSNLRITIPGTNRCIRKVAIGWDQEECEARCTMKTGDSTPDITIRIHRLLKIVEEHHRRGLHYYQPLRQYLGLEEAETFQQIDRFKCECDTSEAGLKALKTRFKHLKNMEWLHVETAIVCDVDHTVGRSQFW